MVQLMQILRRLHGDCHGLRKTRKMMLCQLSPNLKLNYAFSLQNDFPLLFLSLFFLEWEDFIFMHLDSLFLSTAAACCFQGKDYYYYL
jgi:hypothetical protein